MKKYIIGILLLVAMNAMATNYYFSSVNGDDDNSGTTSGAPKQTISAMQTIINSMSSGDTLFLERGSVWYDVYLYVNGRTGITIAAYGTGEKPKLYGHKIMTNIINYSGNIYRAYDAEISTSYLLQLDNAGSGPSYFNYNAPLIINGSPGKMGRYPNTGYLNVENCAADRVSWLQDNDMSWTTNQWVGGFIRFSPTTNSTSQYLAAKWINKAGRITANTSNTLSLSMMQNPEQWYLAPASGYRKIKYVIVNHLNTLDQEGEYSIDFTNRYIYFYSATYQAGDTVTFSVNQEVLYLNLSDDVTIKDLFLYGGMQRTLRVLQSDNFVADSVDFRYTPNAALGFDRSDSYTVSECTFSDANNNAIATYNSSGIITNNKFYRIGIDIAVGGDRDARNYCGVWSQSRSGELIISDNYAKDVGWCFYANTGDLVTTTGNNLYVNNYVVNSTYNYSDGGAAYDFDGEKNPSYSKRIANNVTIDTVFNNGFIYDTLTIDMLYYLDADAVGWEIDSNSGYGANIGVYTHQSDYTKIRNNSFKNSGHYSGDWKAGIQINDGYTSHNGSSYMTNSVITGNRIVSTESTNRVFTWTYNGSFTNRTNTVNNNKYSYQFGTQPFADIISWTVTPRTVSQWQAETGLDLSSQFNQNGITGLTADYVKLISNAKSVGDTIDLYNLTFLDIDGNVKSGNLILGPWEEEFLFYVSGSVDSLGLLQEIYYTQAEAGELPPVDTVIPPTSESDTIGFINFAFSTPVIGWTSLYGNSTGYEQDSIEFATGTWLINTSPKLSAGGSGEPSTILPNQVGSTYHFLLNTDDSKVTFQLKGLDTAYYYTLSWFASRDNVVAAPRTTYFSVGADSVSVEPVGNTSTFVSIDSITTTDSTITFGISKLSGQYGYINAMYVIRTNKSYTPSLAPANAVYFMRGGAAYRPKRYWAIKND